MPKLESFIDRLKWMIDRHSDGKHTAFAKKVGIPTSTFQNIINGQMPKAEHLILISGIFGISIDWLLTGKGGPYLSDIGPGTTLESAVGFNDKIYALDIYRDLTELKRLDPEAFRRVETYIKATIDTLREVAEKSSANNSDRRQKDRRVKNDPEKAPGGQDRRSGKDRRKAGANG